MRTHPVSGKHNTYSKAHIPDNVDYYYDTPIIQANILKALKQDIYHDDINEISEISFSRSEIVDMRVPSRVRIKLVCRHLSCCEKLK